jgi:catechol 2,3-dioxygenase-like lactoylglutathione lyase family enzyme
LEHVNITVSNLDRSIAFYCNLLGLEVRWQGTVRAAHIGDKRHYLAMFETSRKVSPEAKKHFEPVHRLYFRAPDDIEVELVEYGDRT